MSILHQIEREIKIFFFEKNKLLFYCLLLWSIKIIIVIIMQNQIYKNQ